MTAYALLTYTLLGDVAAALPVVKWLSQHWNTLGGFFFTQVSRPGIEGGNQVQPVSHPGPFLSAVCEGTEPEREREREREREKDRGRGVKRQVLLDQTLHRSTAPTSIPDLTQEPSPYLH
jgi:hypothetical protein